MSRALLVIDVQNEYFTGALPITHPAGHLDRILEVMDAAEGKIPTIVIQHHFPQPEKPFFQKGSYGWELHPEVARRPSGAVIFFCNNDANGMCVADSSRVPST